MKPLEAQVTGVGKVLLLNSGYELKADTVGHQWGDKVEVWVNWHTRTITNIQKKGQYYNKYSNY